jgi:hypothetical protein
VKLPRATCHRRQKEQITKKEKGKDYNLLLSPKQPKSLQFGLIIFFFLLCLSMKIYVKTSPKYLLFPIDLISYRK